VEFGMNTMVSHL